MELTRRDAAAALAALGASGAVLGGRRLRDRGDDPGDDPEVGPGNERIRQTMVAAAEVVYPSEIEGIEEFVEEFLDGRLRRPGHGAALRETVEELDDLARSWYDAPPAELSVEERDRLLSEVGADTADEDPKGTTAERVRYYVVNELLLALYASPTGGELVGIENPQGHPGGIDSYTRGPQ